MERHSKRQSESIKSTREKIFPPIGSCTPLKHGTGSVFRLQGVMMDQFAREQSKDKGVN